MATQLTLEVFNHEIESINDYKEHFNFHCTGHQIPKTHWKALFLTRIGSEAFAKLKMLVSLILLNDLSLAQIITTMKQHYNKLNKDTVEIAK